MGPRVPCSIYILCECEFVSSIVYENSDQDDCDDKDDENSDYET